MARTPALEYRWFNTDLKNLKEAGQKQTEGQKEKLKEFEKLSIAGVKLNEVKNLGLAYAPIPLINWLGLYGFVVSGEKLEQANAVKEDGTVGEQLDNIVRSRLSAADNIEVNFAKGVEITSGEIAASRVEAGKKIDLKKYETKQFSIGFPAELTATQDNGEPLYPVKERGTNKRSKTRSKAISMTLFEAWALQLPGDKFEKIAGIRISTKSQLTKVSSRFNANFFEKGALLPGDMANPQIIEAEIVEPTPQFFIPARPQLYLPASVSVSDKLFEDLL